MLVSNSLGPPQLWKLPLFLKGTEVFGLGSTYSRTASYGTRIECLLCVRCCAECIQPIFSLLLHWALGQAGILGWQEQ